MNLVISKKHTTYARRGNTFSCPAAKALRELGFKEVSVDETGATLDGKRYKFPKKLGNVIEAYDQGEAFVHGTYRIAGLRKPSKASK